MKVQRNYEGEEDQQNAAGDLDNLTGVLKKKAAEARIVSMMCKNRSGALLVCDVDRMKRINDQYGHLIGDECLKEVSQVLSYMIRQGDVLGRYGGDEFLIFMSGCLDMEEAQAACRRIENRLRIAAGKGREKIPLSVTAICVLRRPGDTCQSLFERADIELQKHKAAPCMTGEQENWKKDQYIKDARKIRRELIEQIKKTGAYCQDYETFKGIYRFLERGIIRSGQKACVVLMTVVDDQGGNLLPYEKDAMMERLGEDIRSTLRIGDVYTRYSSSQYLVLVIGTTEEQGDMIGDRIKEKFLKESPGKGILMHHCYELQPARVVEITGKDELCGELVKMKKRGKL